MPRTATPAISHQAASRGSSNRGLRLRSGSSGPERLLLVAAACITFLASCGSQERASASAERPEARQLCAAHLPEVGTGATITNASAAPAPQTAARIRRAGADPSPWDTLSADDVVVECHYVLPAGRSNPAVRCGPDVVDTPGSATAYFFDRAGRHSIALLNGNALGRQCSGSARSSSSG
jgi:hypothetical protein